METKGISRPEAGAIQDAAGHGRPRCHQPGRGLAILLLRMATFVLVAMAITAVWTYYAQTEKREPFFASIPRNYRGETEEPFFYRRLTYEAGALVARVVPASGWSALSDRIDGSPWLRSTVRDRMCWQRQDDPLLFGVTSCIGFSVLGFMLSARWLLRRLYDSPARMPSVLAVVLGVGLLGGRGLPIIVWHQYPYDLPQAFLFLAGTCCVIAGNWLIVPVALLAFINKETSVLLIPVVLLLWPRPSRRRLLLAAMMGIAYAAIQVWIRHRFHPLRGTWGESSFAMNALHGLAFGVWRLPLWGLAVAVIVRRWREIPIEVRKMAFVPVVLVGAAWVRGWIMEYRAFLEAYPFVALMILQVLFAEAGRPGWLRGRRIGPDGTSAAVPPGGEVRRFEASCA